ncbi:hypothetical protein BKA64DRAFT_127052 [Cadophora sp. MPI-SDFR-AT-0126]|nr:hypothetical protein BKA64DRAFT_127052 [Leotiomycetes sp. MPI-SDFR-AT-0126]
MNSSNMDDQPKDPDTESEQEEVEAFTEDEIAIDPATILKYQQTFQDLLIKEGSTALPQNPMPDCEANALEWENRVASGWAIYERMTARVHETKIKEHGLIAEIKKFFKQDSSSYFVFQHIDINIEGEAKGTRLGAGTNRKRARSISLHYLNLHDSLFKLTASEEHDACRLVRARSEEIDAEAACERGRSLRRAGDKEPWTEEGHVGDDMSERSSGKTRRTRSSLALTIEGHADVPGGADASGTLEEEVPEPAGAVEAPQGFQNTAI